MSVNVNILVDGKPNQKINHSGNTYLPVVNGTEFQIKIENNNNYRVAAVISVDGLNVIDASKADYDGRGYIVNARSHLIVKGWRHSQEEVSKFVFVDKSSGEGYADKLKRGKDVGVIGVAIFKEVETHFIPAFTIDKPAPIVKPWIYPEEWPHTPWRKEEGPYPTVTLNNCAAGAYNQLGGLENSTSYSSSAQPTKKSLRSRGPGASSVGRQESAVGSGDKVVSRTHTVEFNRVDKPEVVVALYYDTVDGLRSKGVPVDQYIGKPNPFPGEKVGYYCPEV